MSVLTRGPALLQIGSDGRAHIGGHWQELLTSTLAAHSRVTAVPVAVFESQRDDLVRMKPKTHQEQLHGAIAQPTRVLRSQLATQPLLFVLAKRALLE